MKRRLNREFKKAKKLGSNAELHSHFSDFIKSKINVKPREHSTPIQEDWTVRMQEFSDLVVKKEQSDNYLENSESVTIIESNDSSSESELFDISESPEKNVISRIEDIDSTCEAELEPDGEKEKMAFGEESESDSQHSEVITADSEIIVIESEQASQQEQLPFMKKDLPNCVISDCESSEEPDYGTDLLHITDESPCKSSVVTSISKEISNVQNDNGSAWIKNIQWQMSTPKKQENKTEETPEDSAKKQKKKNKCGFAGQLSRLLIRDKSGLIFWTFSLKDCHKKNPKILLVKILAIKMEYSLMITLAQTVCNSETSTEHLTVTPFPEQLWVLFTKDSSQEMKLCNGSLVEIHPPWQKLKLPIIPQRLILCTQYSQLISQDLSMNSEDHVLKPKSYDVDAEWKCPCSLDPLIPITNCLANLQFSKSEECTSSDSNSLLLSADHNLYFHTIKDSPEVTLFKFESVLEMAENCGPSNVTKMGLAARIERIFCSKISPNQVRWSLLLQDKHGMFCELLLEDDNVPLGPPWNSLFSLDGSHTYIFQPVKIVQRINSAKYPALFSVIASICKQRKASQCHENYFCLPNFCYVLSAEKESHYLKAVSDIDLSPLSCSFFLLKDCLENSNQFDRMMICARLIYCTNQNLYIMDKSLLEDSLLADSKSYVILSLKSSCYLFESVKKSLHKGGTVLIIKDVVFIQDQFYADGYSYLLLASHLNSDPLLGYYLVEDKVLINLQTIKPELPGIYSKTKSQDLITLSGIVSGVDEATAFSWPVCNFCNDEKLFRDSKSGLICSSCQKFVSSPVIKMKLEIFIKSPQFFSNHLIKVQLLQQTIESLLLISESNPHKEYEIDDVLGKQIGPLTCLVYKIENVQPEQLLYYLKEINLL